MPSNTYCNNSLASVTVVDFSCSLITGIAFTTLSTLSITLSMSKSKLSLAKLVIVDSAYRLLTSLTTASTTALPAAKLSTIPFTASATSTISASFMPTFVTVPATIVVISSLTALTIASTSSSFTTTSTMCSTDSTNASTLRFLLSSTKLLIVEVSYNDLTSVNTVSTTALSFVK